MSLERSVLYIYNVPFTTAQLYTSVLSFSVQKGISDIVWYIWRGVHIFFPSQFDWDGVFEANRTFKVVIYPSFIFKSFSLNRASQTIM